MPDSRAASLFALGFRFAEPPDRFDKGAVSATPSGVSFQACVAEVSQPLAARTRSASPICRGENCFFLSLQL